jgi:hypothetical protein
MSAGYVVLDEWVDAAKNAAWGPYWHSMTPEQQGKAFDEMRAALSAMIPAIQNAALERAAVWHDEQAAGMDGPDRDGESNTSAILRKIAAEQHRNSAAAIRALMETKE